MPLPFTLPQRPRELKNDEFRPRYADERCLYPLPFHNGLVSSKMTNSDLETPMSDASTLYPSTTALACACGAGWPCASNHQAHRPGIPLMPENS
jgi:hypothetical protein